MHRHVCVQLHTSIHVILLLILLYFYYIGVLCTCVCAYTCIQTFTSEDNFGELVLSFYHELRGLNSWLSGLWPSVSAHWDILPACLHWFLRDTHGSLSGIIICSKYLQVFLYSLSQAPTKAQEHRWGFKGIFNTNTRLECLWKNWESTMFSVVTQHLFSVLPISIFLPWMPTELSDTGSYF